MQNNVSHWNMVCMNSLSMLRMMNYYCDIDQNRKNGPNVVETSNFL